MSSLSFYCTFSKLLLPASSQLCWLKSLLSAKVAKWIIHVQRCCTSETRKTLLPSSSVALVKATWLGQGSLVLLSLQTHLIFFLERIMGSTKSDFTVGWCHSQTLRGSKPCLPMMKADACKWMFHTDAKASLALLKHLLHQGAWGKRQELSFGFTFQRKGRACSLHDHRQKSAN